MCNVCKIVGLQHKTEALKHHVTGQGDIGLQEKAKMLKTVFFSPHIVTRVVTSLPGDWLGGALSPLIGVAMSCLVTSRKTLKKKEDDVAVDWC